MLQHRISIAFTDQVDESQVFALAELCTLDVALLGLMPVATVSIHRRPIREESPKPASGS
jgi:hypothetical protein